MFFVVCKSQLSRGEKLKCEFEDKEYSIYGKFYSCDVSFLDNQNDNLSIDGYSGSHLTNKNDTDVKGIWISIKFHNYKKNFLSEYFSKSTLIEN